MSSPPRWKSFTIIAELGDRFSDFAPYVASINDVGTVAFQAAMSEGGTGVFFGNGSEIRCVANSRDGRFREFFSHPDIDADHRLSFYASDASGARGVFRSGEHDDFAELASTADGYGEIGPLGPTMNDDGVVAFRAAAAAGGHGIFAGGSRAGVRLIGDTMDVFRGFQGLPVVDRTGGVLFRADHADGGAGIYLDRVGSFSAIVETGELFTALAAFPSMNDEGTVAFCGALANGGSGVFTSTISSISAVIDTRDPFESFRGALINNSDELIFFGVPRGEKLGIFCGPDPERHRILAVGDKIFGSVVADFALNPVSLNNANQLAIRLRLADERQFIVRAEPDG